jgi:hypothetical protein
MNLYESQKRDYETLIDYINIYQPEPFNKAWASDIDYINLIKKFQIKDKAEVTTKKKKKIKSKKSSNKLI